MKRGIKKRVCERFLEKKMTSSRNLSVELSKNLSVSDERLESTTELSEINIKWSEIKNKISERIKWLKEFTSSNRNVHKEIKI